MDTLSEAGMRGLGIQPVGVRRRLTLRARGLVACDAKTGGSAAPSDGGNSAADGKAGVSADAAAQPAGAAAALARGEGAEAEKEANEAAPGLSVAIAP